MAREERRKPWIVVLNFSSTSRELELELEALNARPVPVVRTQRVATRRKLKIFIILPPHLEFNCTFYLSSPSAPPPTGFRNAIQNITLDFARLDDDDRDIYTYTTNIMNFGKSVPNLYTLPHMVVPSWFTNFGFGGVKFLWFFQYGFTTT